MFWNNLVNLCNQHQTTPTSVVKSLGIAAGSVTKWKSGVLPRSTTLAKIAGHFGVTVDYLLGKEEKPATESDELNEYLEELKNRSEMRMLFSLAKGATKEDVERAVAIIEALRKNENG